MGFRQFLAAFSVNLMTLNYGITLGWAAPNMIFFQTDDSPVGKLTMAEISPIASLLCIGGALGTLVFGYFTKKIGRKTLMLAAAVPQAIALVLLITGDHPYYLYASRVLTGLSAGAIFVVVPIFVGEISNPKIRGALGALVILFYNLGIMLGFLMASYLNYYLVSYITLGILIAYFVVFLPFPESPEYLIYKEYDKAAENSFKFYNGVSKTKPLPIELQSTHDELKAFVSKQNENVKQNQSIFKEFRDKAALLGLIYSTSTVLFSNLSGNFVILNYLTYLFEKASIDIDIYLCTIVVGCVQIVGSCTALILVDKFGRRFLFMASASLSGLLMATCGLYFYFIDEPSYAEAMLKVQWLPLVAICGFIFVCNTGMACLPFFMISELVPVHLRGTVGTTSSELSWILVFFMLQFFHIVIYSIGIYGVMGFFAFCCFSEVIFIYFCMPETKGITFQEIQSKLYEGRI